MSNIDEPMARLIACVREVENLPHMTKAAIKNQIFKNKCIDWRRLRLTLAHRPEFRPQSWKADLINTLLSRTFPHGGARRRAAAPVVNAAEHHPSPLVNVPVEAGQASVVLAVLHLLHLLPPRLRRALVRHSLEEPLSGTIPAVPVKAGGVPPVRTTATRYVAILGRRRVRSWKGQSCFTGRILSRTGYMERSASDIVSACATLLRWWDAEGRPGTLTLRPANAFTAHLPLLYTTLPPHDPLHDAACRQLHPGGEVAGNAGPRMPVPDCAMIPADEAWRAFTRRFPVLGVYQPIWVADRDPTLSVLRGTAPEDTEAWEALWRHHDGLVPFEILGAALRWPMDIVKEHGGEAVVSMLARTLQPSEPWEHWLVSMGERSAYRRPAVWHLRRAVALLLGFGDICANVLEAIRLPARLRGEEATEGLGVDDANITPSATTRVGC